MMAEAALKCSSASAVFAIDAGEGCMSKAFLRDGWEGRG